MNKKIGIVVGVICIIAIIVACVVMGGKGNGNGKKVFIIGMDDSFPPFGYRDENNNLVGFDVDIARAVCDKLGWELKVQPISWAAKEQELDSRND